MIATIIPGTGLQAGGFRSETFTNALYLADNVVGVVIDTPLTIIVIPKWGNMLPNRF
jgi:hypothetical protein